MIIKNSIPITHSEKGQSCVPVQHTKMHALSILTTFPRARLIFLTTQNILGVDLSCLVRISNNEWQKQNFQRCC